MIKERFTGYGDFGGMIDGVIQTSWKHIATSIERDSAV